MGVNNGHQEMECTSHEYGMYGCGEQLSNSIFCAAATVTTLQTSATISKFYWKHTASHSKFSKSANLKKNQKLINFPWIQPIHYLVFARATFRYNNSLKYFWASGYQLLTLFRSDSCPPSIDFVQPFPCFSVLPINKQICPSEAC